MIQLALASGILILTTLVSPLSANKIIEEPVSVVSTVQAQEQAPLGVMAQAVYAAEQNQPKEQFNENMQWPIASLTKIMAALIALENDADLNKVIALQKSDMVEGAAVRVPVGTKFTGYDLLHASLMGSANNATKALVRTTNLTEQQFVEKMNIKAKEMGLVFTQFTEPTGLDPENKSTAKEYTEIFNAALQNQFIAQVMQKTSYTIKPINHASFTIGTTNKLLSEPSDYQVIAGKTGFTYGSRYNFAAKFTKEGKEVSVVVLGDKTYLEAFESNKKIAEKAFGK